MSNKSPNYEMIEEGKGSSIDFFEVVPLNQRSLFGRIVINPPERTEFGLYKADDKWFLCFCGRGFLSEEKFKLHQSEHSTKEDIKE